MSERPLPTTVAQALAQARQGGVDRLDAQLMLCTLLQRPRAWLLAHDEDALPADLAERYASWAHRRAQGEPLAYLLGDKEFYGLNLGVGPDVLIPRPDTETLVEWALELIPAGPLSSPFEVLDLGTGSGAIALALQHHRPQARVTAVDASPGALAVAQANAQRLKLPVENLPGSWFEPVAGRHFDLVVSNPPYIAEDDEHMAALRFEPKQALTSGATGLDDLCLITAEASRHLKPGGWLLLEHGYNQAEAVSDLLKNRGFRHVGTRTDLGKNPRCTGGQKPHE
ncbi:peptide chain release factor N(5)-glutamine methyltransferase [Aquabacterium sp.]|uniref:peptide chain release factor N(5)-glutamine methyltransferase n=1 Tax=Aquabacterium sp. TaxID=1872578 RepID=UPI003D6C9A2E